MMRTKSLRVLILLSIVFISMFSTSCKKGSDIKVGLLIPAEEGYRWIHDKFYIEKAAKEANVEVISYEANNDENLQQKQAVEILDKGIDVLILVSVNSNTAASIVREAHSKDVPVIAYDRIIKNCDLDYFLTFENDKVGSLMIDYAIENKPSGNYIMLYGESGDMNAQVIKAAQEKALEPYINNGQINILYKTFVEDWSRENAEHIMDKILSVNEQPIDAIITSYDGLAISAVKSLINAGYDPSKIVITGQDAEIGAIKAIANDQMSLTIYKPIGVMAKAAIDLAIKIAKGENIQLKTYTNNERIDVPSMFLPPVLVNKNNIETTVIADNFLTREQIYGNE